MLDISRCILFLSIYLHVEFILTELFLKLDRIQDKLHLYLLALLMKSNDIDR